MFAPVEPIRLSRKISGVRIGCHVIGISGSLAEFEIWAWRINRCRGKFYSVTSCLPLPCLPLLPSVRSLLQRRRKAWTRQQLLLIEATLLAEEQQVQQDVEDLVKAHEEANCKCEDLAKKWRDAQVAWEKCEAEQCEADAKVRGKLLTNAVVAEVWRRFVCQAEKARLMAEKLQAERDASRSPHKVWMKLGVSVFLFLFIA